MIFVPATPGYFFQSGRNSLSLKQPAALPKTPRRGRCTRVCPASLPVERKERLLSPECSGCMDCVGICPAPGTLRLSTTGRVWKATALGVTILMIFAGSVLSARITGHWQGELSERQFRLLLLSTDSPELTHPGLEKN